MKKCISPILFSLLVCYLVVQCQSAASAKKDDKVYVKQWALRVEGGERVARDVAEDHGFKFVRQIGTLKDLYLVKHEDGKRSKRRADLHDNLERDPRVQWVQQQHLNEHHKRDFRALPDDILPADATGDDDKPLKFNDPLFKKQWYLFNEAQNGAVRGIDMNVMPAWKLGITGHGVVVSIVDDGVDPTHPDLAPNFDMDASHDFQNETHDNDPNPHPDDSEEAGSTNDHGTKCAGEVAAAANNSVCGVGVAYEANIGGMRVLDGPVTDSIEAEALNFNNQYIDVYSCCWGPPDDGDNFRGPHPLTAEALETGVKEGRGGKGSIFVWASGNGGEKDDCAADGYVSNIRTISIGAINDEGLSAYFVESCPSTMAVVISGGPHTSGSYYSKRGETLNLVVTTDIHHKCTERFVGTSSSAPLASGVMALILQANPELTWRDVQHIVAEGAMIPNVKQDGWHVNGAGFHVNPLFGFGVLDAGKMVELALTWEKVKEQQQCDISKKDYNKKIPMGEARNVTMKVTSCTHIAKLEHTIAQISFKAPRRGDISIRLISPSGTPSQLLSTRSKDHTDEGLEDWPFMTVHNWGEDPNGEWTLEVSNNIPSEEVLEDFLNHQESSDDDDDDDESDEEGEEYLDLVPRLTEAAELVNWGFTFYGTGPEKDTKGDGKVKDEPEDDNPAINPELAGAVDEDTIIDIWNDEQEDDEEINIDPDDLSPDADIPPNVHHNFDSGEIDTGAFDGQVANDDTLSLTPEEREVILQFLILLDLHELDDKFTKKEQELIMEFLLLINTADLEELLREVALEEEYTRVQNAVTSYKKEAELRYRAEMLQKAEEERRRKEEEEETARRRSEQLSREEVILLLEELQRREGRN